MNNLLGLLNAAAGGQNGGSTMIVMVIYIVVFAAIIYFFMLRPQKKQQAKQDALMSSMEIGDSVLTTAGFYGTIIDISDDMVIVEFGNNKNCRIPMQKRAVVEIEKANQSEDK